MRCMLEPRSDTSAVGLHEDAVALQVDDLLGLGDREGDRVVAALMGVGPDEAMLFHAFRCVLLDDPGGLEGAIVSVRRRTNAIALVFDRRRRGRSRLARSSPAGEPVPGCFELREHGYHRHVMPRRDHAPIIARLPVPVDRLGAWPANAAPPQ